MAPLHVLGPTARVTASPLAIPATSGPAAAPHPPALEKLNAEIWHRGCMKCRALGVSAQQKGSMGRRASTSPALPTPVLFLLAGARAECFRAPQRSTACPQAHLREESHGGDFPLYVPHAENQEQVVEDPVALLCGAGPQLPGGGKKVLWVLRQAAKPHPGLHRQV